MWSPFQQLVTANVAENIKALHYWSFGGVTHLQLVDSPYKSCRQSKLKLIHNLWEKYLSEINFDAKVMSILNYKIEP